MYLQRYMATRLLLTYSTLILDVEVRSVLERQRCVVGHNPAVIDGDRDALAVVEGKDVLNRLREWRGTVHLRLRPVSFSMVVWSANDCV